MHDDDSHIFQVPGTSCNDYRGFCTADHYCAGVDRDSVYDRLNQYLAAKLDEVLLKMAANFWVFAIFAAAGAVFMAYFVRAHLEVKKEKEEAKEMLVGKAHDVTDEALIYLEELERQLLQVEEAFKRQVEELGHHEQMNPSSALSRLVSFFPSTSCDILESALINVDNEENAVRALILMKCPFKKMFIPENQPLTQRRITKNPVTTSNRPSPTSRPSTTSRPYLPSHSSTMSRPSTMSHPSTTSYPNLQSHSSTMSRPSTTNPSSTWFKTL